MIGRISPVSFGSKVKIINDSEFQLSRRGCEASWQYYDKPSFEEQIEELENNGKSDLVILYAGNGTNTHGIKMYIEDADGSETYYASQKVIFPRLGPIRRETITEMYDKYTSINRNKE